MTRRKKTAVRKRLRRRRALFREFGQELIEFVEAGLVKSLRDEEDKAILFGNGQCLPSSDCGCIGHRMPGVSHFIACCDKPHITVEEYNKSLGFKHSVKGLVGGGS